MAHFLAILKVAALVVGWVLAAGIGTVILMGLFIIVPYALWEHYTFEDSTSQGRHKQ